MSSLPSVPAPPRYGPHHPAHSLFRPPLTTQDPSLWKPLTEPHSMMIYDQVTGWCSMVVTAERFRGWFWPGRQPGDRWWRSERRSVTKAEVGAAALLPPMSTCLVCLLPPVPTCPADTCTTAAGPVCIFSHHADMRTPGTENNRSCRGLTSQSAAERKTIQRKSHRKKKQYTHIYIYM